MVHSRRISFFRACIDAYITLEKPKDVPGQSFVNNSRNLSQKHFCFSDGSINSNKIS